MCCKSVDESTYGECVARHGGTRCEADWVRPVSTRQQTTDRQEVPNVPNPPVECDSADVGAGSRLGDLATQAMQHKGVCNLPLFRKRPTSMSQIMASISRRRPDRGVSCQLVNEVVGHHRPYSHPSAYCTDRRSSRSLRCPGAALVGPSWNRPIFSRRASAPTSRSWVVH
jgi:hypothetical protein